jgi:HPr kinase/phosphorylase
MPGTFLIDSHAGLRVANCQLHAGLVRVFGTGVLLIGESGAGKTTCAIELLRRGHAFIADDAVQIFHHAGRLIGKAPASTAALVHTRLAGITSVYDLVEHVSVEDECYIDLCIEICRKGKSASEFRLPIRTVPLAGESPSVDADRVESIVRNYNAGPAL